MCFKLVAPFELENIQLEVKLGKRSHVVICMQTQLRQTKGNQEFILKDIIISTLVCWLCLILHLPIANITKSVITQLKLSVQIACPLWLLHIYKPETCTMFPKAANRNVLNILVNSSRSPVHWVGNRTSAISQWEGSELL